MLDNKILANFLPLGVCSSLRRLVLWAEESWERYLAEKAAKIGFYKGICVLLGFEGGRYWVFGSQLEREKLNKAKQTLETLIFYKKLIVIVFKTLTSVIIYNSEV